MKGFKEFLLKQKKLEEGVVKKGAVAAYALQGKKHGDKAVHSFNRAKQALRSVANSKSADAKIEALIRAHIDLLDGLVSQRQQIGSVSAQVTSLTLL
jgi:hypothetical protein